MRQFQSDYKCSLKITLSLGLVIAAFFLTPDLGFSKSPGQNTKSGKGAYISKCTQNVSRAQDTAYAKIFCQCMVKILAKHLSDKDFLALSRLKDSHPDVKIAARAENVKENETTLGQMEFDAADHCSESSPPKKK